MTPEELEALADRVEAGEATDQQIADALDAIPPSLRGWAEPPAYLTSLDAAAQVMPWQYDSVSISHEPPGGVTVKVAIWRMGDKPHRSGQVTAFAPTECAARVAAGLRARAHVLRNGGAA